MAIFPPTRIHHLDRMFLDRTRRVVANLVPVLCHTNHLVIVLGRSLRPTEDRLQGAHGLERIGRRNTGVSRLEILDQRTRSARDRERVHARHPSGWISYVELRRVYA